MAGEFMKYTTNNEFQNFEFSEVHINDVMYANGSFKIGLDDVKILPENSCNRDIRKMRANGLILTLHDAEIITFVEEGYKIYDADGNLKKTEADVAVDEQDYKDVFENFIDGNAYLIDKKDDEFNFVIDGINERTYSLTVKAAQDTEEWDKFLSLE